MAPAGSQPAKAAAALQPLLLAIAFLAVEASPPALPPQPPAADADGGGSDDNSLWTMIQLGGLSMGTAFLSAMMAFWQTRRQQKKDMEANIVITRVWRVHETFLQNELKIE